MNLDGRLGAEPLVEHLFSLLVASLARVQQHVMILLLQLAPLVFIQPQVSQMVGPVVRQIHVEVILIAYCLATAILRMRLPLFETYNTTLTLRALIDDDFVVVDKIHVLLDVLVR